MSAAVFGLFSFVWFGWAQESPPAGFAVPLGIASGVGALLAIGGGLLSWRHWDSPTALDPSGPSWRSYLVTVGVGVMAVAAVGAVALGLSPLARFIPVWILLVVGVHFLALAPILSMPALNVLAALMTVVAVAVAAVAIALATRLQPSFLTGILAGPLLLVFAVLAAALWLTTSGAADPA